MRIIPTHRREIGAQTYAGQQPRRPAWLHVLHAHVHYARSLANAAALELEFRIVEAAVMSYRSGDTDDQL